MCLRVTDLDSNKALLPRKNKAHCIKLAAQILAISKAHFRGRSKKGKSKLTSLDFWLLCKIRPSQKMVDKKVFGMWRWLGVMLASQFLKEFAEGGGVSRTIILSCFHGRILHRSRPPVNGSRVAKRDRLELRGGSDSFGTSQSMLPEADEARLRAIDAEWDLCGKEWEYCMVPDEEGIGRALNPDPVPCQLSNEDSSGGPQLLNLDGTTPGPEVWKNPNDEYRAAGWLIDPFTAPAPLVIEHGLKFLDFQESEIMKQRKYGPDISHHNLPEGHLYWDRDGGTRPFVNLRDLLPEGWRQLKFAGSTMVLAPDHTFVHNDDPFNTNFNSWGADPADRGTWSLDNVAFLKSWCIVVTFCGMRRCHFLWC